MFNKSFGFLALALTPMIATVVARTPVLLEKPVKTGGPKLISASTAANVVFLSSIKALNSNALPANARIITPESLNNYYRSGTGKLNANLDSDMIIYDLRLSAEYEDGHLEGATTIPTVDDGLKATYDTQAEKIYRMKNADDYKYAVFHCSSSKNRGLNIALAYWKLISQDTKFKRQTVVLLQGGWDAVVEFNYAAEVEKGRLPIDGPDFEDNLYQKSKTIAADDEQATTTATIIAVPKKVTPVVDTTDPNEDSTNTTGDITDSTGFNSQKDTTGSTTKEIPGFTDLGSADADANADADSGEFEKRTVRRSHPRQF